MRVLLNIELKRASGKSVLEQSEWMGMAAMLNDLQCLYACNHAWPCAQDDMVLIVLIK